MKKFIFLIVIFTFSTIIAQENAEKGYPLIRNYSPKEYNADIENYGIAQGSLGVMYFANYLGLLEYNGVNWRLIKFAESDNYIRSLSIAPNGNIYTVSGAEFGYFSPGSLGNLKFHSLLKFLPKECGNLLILTVLSIGDKVYFAARDTSSKYIVFVWSVKDKKFTTLTGKNLRNTLFNINGECYVRDQGRGLLKQSGDSLKLISGGEKFADVPVPGVYPFHEGKYKMLAATRNELFKYDGKSFIKFKTEADGFLKENLINIGMVLNDNNIILGTFTGGIVVIDKFGKIIKLIDKAAGLPSNYIAAIFQDRAGEVWAATSNGISRIDYNSPAEYFDARNNLAPDVYAVYRYKGTLYATTNSMTFYLNDKTSTFIPISNIVGGGASFAVSAGKLMVGTYNGLFNIDKDKVIPIKKSDGTAWERVSLIESKFNNKVIYASTNYDLRILKYKNGKWLNAGKIIQFPSYTIAAEESADTLWAGGFFNGVFRVTYDSLKNGNINYNEPKVTKFASEKGLPNMRFFPQMINNKVYFFSNKFDYVYDAEKDTFLINNSFQSLPALGSRLSYLTVAPGSNDKVWATMGKEPAYGIQQKDGSFNWVKAPFKRFSDEIVQGIYPEKNGIVWFGTGYGIIKYDLNKRVEYDSSFSVLISQVFCKPDSQIYYGHGYLNFKTSEISYENNSLKFEYAAVSYEDEGRNQYTTILEGFDDSWSGWSKDHTKEYTNLPPGDYTFKVAAKNLFDIKSKEASFKFEILPPWYRTWFAYAGYAVLLGFLFFGVSKMQKKRVTKKERELSLLRETELRAEAAEADAKALQIENERKKNVELLSEIGRDITANLSIEQIIDTVYENVNSLMDASVFGIGLYNNEFDRIDFPATREKGEKLPPFFNLLSDENRPAIWCYKNQKEILTNDYQKDYKKYIKERKETAAGARTESVIYLPLTYKDKKIGVITAQAFKKNSYTDYHLNILKNLATYTAIAIDNADAYRQLHETVTKLDIAINDLKSTQEKLIVQQKLASLGQLTAGIAHEIKNPLNFVNNFAEVSAELVGELKEEINELKNKVPGHSFDGMLEIIRDLEENSNRITQHGKRADSIVKSMLQHSRGKAGERQETDINAILDEDINLAYHGMRARDASFNIMIEKEFDKNLSKVSVVPQDVSRVFLNIIQNGFYETNKKKIQNGNSYLPKILIQTFDEDNHVKVKIRDNGNGIPVDAQNKLFEPFFTTKPSGEGTGLGLSLSFDIIVKQHGGDIKFETEPGKFAEFIITLPKN